MKTQIVSTTNVGKCRMEATLTCGHSVILPDQSKTSGEFDCLVCDGEPTNNPVVEEKEASPKKKKHD